MDQIQPRVVVISGGGAGIGKATAAAFVQRGDIVFLLGRRAHVLQRAVEELGDRATAIAADVSQREQVVDAIGQVVAQSERIDVLVNAAGFARGVGAGLSLQDAEPLWDEVMGTVLKGSFLMSLARAPHLSRPGGRIIMISSVAAYTGGSRGGSIEYAAAKAGLHGLTMGLARELSPAGITVNAIVPGFIAQTEFTGDWSEERVRSIVAQILVGRGGQAMDIASAVLCLAAPDAGFITGEILNVNGGWLFGR
jgi:3-oxoacyl-[acyl-carrier protein] reductase